MRLYFVRHGESEANLLRVISNRGLVHGLSEKGRQQAVALGETLAQSGISAVFSSPLLRATQTAEILSAALRLDYVVTDALREYDCGVIEGKSDAQSWELHRRTREDWLLRGQWERRIDGGESFLDIRNRFEPFIEDLLATCPADASLLLVGHGGLYYCMLPQVLSACLSPTPASSWQRRARKGCTVWNGAGRRYVIRDGCPISKSSGSAFPRASCLPGAAGPDLPGTARCG
jgi:probable phosphoglycerate mutase